MAVVGVVGSGAGGVERLAEGLVEPLVARGHTVAVTLTPTAHTWLGSNGQLGQARGAHRSARPRAATTPPRDEPSPAARRPRRGAGHLQHRRQAGPRHRRQPGADAAVRERRGHSDGRVPAGQRGARTATRLGVAPRRPPVVRRPPGVRRGRVAAVRATHCTAGSEPCRGTRSSRRSTQSSTRRRSALPSSRQRPRTAYARTRTVCPGCSASGHVRWT